MRIISFVSKILKLSTISTKMLIIRKSITNQRYSVGKIKQKRGEDNTEQYLTNGDRRKSYEENPNSKNNNHIKHDTKNNTNIKKVNNNNKDIIEITNIRSNKITI